MDPNHKTTEDSSSDVRLLAQRLNQTEKELKRVQEDLKKDIDRVETTLKGDMTKINDRVEKMSDFVEKHDRSFDRMEFIIDGLNTSWKDFEARMMTVVSDQKDTLTEKIDNATSANDVTKSFVTSGKEILIEVLKTGGIIIAAMFGYDSFIQ